MFDTQKTSFVPCLFFSKIDSKGFLFLPRFMTNCHFVLDFLAQMEVIAWCSSMLFFAIKKEQPMEAPFFIC